MEFLLYFVAWLSCAYWTHRMHKGMCRMGIFGEDPDFAVAANFLWPVLVPPLRFEYLRYKPRNCAERRRKWGI